MELKSSNTKMPAGLRPTAAVTCPEPRASGEGVGRVCSLDMALSTASWCSWAGRRIFCPQICLPKKQHVSDISFFPNRKDTGKNSAMMDKSLALSSWHMDVRSLGIQQTCTVRTRLVCRRAGVSLQWAPACGNLRPVTPKCCRCNGC